MIKLLLIFSFGILFLIIWMFLYFKEKIPTDVRKYIIIAIFGIAIILISFFIFIWNKNQLKNESQYDE